MQSGRGALRRPAPTASSGLFGVVYLTTSNGRIMSFSSCSRMWQ